MGVVVTREEAEGGLLSELLADRGFRVYHWPTIRTAPPADPGPLEGALKVLDTFTWAVFTSPRAAKVVEGQRRPDGLKVAAVGESTGEALADVGWMPDRVPGTQTGRSLVIELRDAGMGPADRVFFPASAIARETIPEGLTALGAEVVEVEAYRTEPAPLDEAACRAELEAGAIGIITFTSPSTVQNLQEALGPETFGLAVRRTRAVAIGPTTAEAVRSAGFDDVAVADPHSLEGLAQRVAEVADPEQQEEAT